jgi:two-component system, sensor histidine kinase
MQHNSNPYREDVVAMIVHELRSPLATMSSALELCRAGAPPQAVSVSREVLARQLGKALRLVDDLLDVTRLKHETALADGEPVDLSDVVRGEVEEFRERYRARNQALDLDLPENAVWVRGERVRLGQIVANLLDNSSKYSPVGGRIAVRLILEPGHVVLSVQDSGAGIRQQDLPYVFDAFFRGSSPQCRLQGGVGLGLALVRRLVELHGGTVAAHSGGDNCGSEFTVRLPVIETCSDKAKRADDGS